ncbi:hypothetical protein AB6A40_006935 [Gnathostoma spinigerum]|uniref:Uncharacterized protein n=1 Tax=Gnathostoma spinigerum TaxID=75299 RepID=A0ABD6EKD5_9BILA
MFAVSSILPIFTLFLFVDGTLTNTSLSATHNSPERYDKVYATMPHYLRSSYFGFLSTADAADHMSLIDPLTYAVYVVPSRQAFEDSTEFPSFQAECLVIARVTRETFVLTFQATDLNISRVEVKNTAGAFVPTVFTTTQDNKKNNVVIYAATPVGFRSGINTIKFFYSGKISSPKEGGIFRTNYTDSFGSQR